MSEVGNELLKKLASAIDEAVEVGEDIFADGKVDMSDAMHVPRLGSPVKAIYEVIKEIKALGEEAKDLDWNEFGEIVAVFND